jgi:hypothetical protein
MIFYEKNPRNPAESVAEGPSQRFRNISEKNNNYLKFNLSEIYDRLPGKIRTYFI